MENGRSRLGGRFWRLSWILIRLLVEVELALSQQEVAKKGRVVSPVLSVVGIQFEMAL
jgi:hypothetical protein